MNAPTTDSATFAFLASCVGDFAQWPQCSIVALHGNNEGGHLFGILFKATARNPEHRTVFRIVVTKDDEWRVRVFQIANHVILDERNADRDLIIRAVNRFAGLAGMRKGEDRD